jgi:hypothetical protein
MGAYGSSSLDLDDENDNAIVVDSRSGERAAVRASGLVAEQRAISHRPCDCCDGEVACVRGTLSEGGSTVAVYFATFTVGHPQVVRLALGFPDGSGASALLDLSIVGGELVVEPADDDRADVTPFIRLATAIRDTDEVVGKYLAVPRTSIIREIR